MKACPFCDTDGGRLVYRGRKLRVVHASEDGFPAFYRVIWQAHEREFTDLPRADRMLCMDAVAVVERAVREHLQPDKMNLAALGNRVPHLHWHVIGRFLWDTHFPQPVWSKAERDDDDTRLQGLWAQLPLAEKDMAHALAELAQ
ncbi:MAG: HIT family protein [Betaproteobacteria bacterium]|nr:HIT family protein [Betaproteobacteria bacterium]MDE2047605.1 HIT family protein [Betaproteobacteria bacterium]